ncbi:MAG TPA: chemotaxis protein CheD [Calditrichia bacterium]|nr:chemotaxis protein CheD [Calditrichota bacterium]HQU72340.1 chemotaxis protein CheD [Calditrichia bacterium]HQV31881.1 chemotaxis protein CheD [Calditrichia bacterium]
MGMKMVGIGEFGVSDKADSIVKTMALGSCVAAVFLAPSIKMVGMVHIALPDSTIDPVKAARMPGYFADTAIPLLIKKFRAMGVQKPSELTVKLIGGASIMDPSGTFNIGKRNVLATRKMLWKFRLGAKAEDVGKDFSRTVWVDAQTGKVKVFSPDHGEWEV